MEENISLEKKTLRAVIRHNRVSFTKQSIKHASELVAKHLFSTVHWRNAKTVGVYASVAGEVITRDIFTQAWKEKKRCGAPTLIEHSKIVYREITNWVDLKRGHWRILEPKSSCPLLLPRDIDLLLIPGLAFDKEGNRLGGGYAIFDHYLATLPNTTHRMGLAFSWQCFEQIPYEEHDQQLHTILIEQGQFFPKT